MALFSRAVVVSLAGLLLAASPAFSALDIQSGGVRGTLTWNGVGVPRGMLTVVDEASGRADTTASSGVYWVSPLLPGPSSLRLGQPGCPGLDWTTALGATTVVAGQSAVADFDVTSKVGLLTANFTRNGTTGRVSYRLAERPCFGGSADGPLVAYLLPGSYTLEVYLREAAPAHRITFTVFAGQTVDLGTIDVAAGSVAGTISWQGQPFSRVNSTQALDVIVSNGGRTTARSGGFYQLTELYSGVHGLAVVNNGCPEDGFAFAGFETEIPAAGQANVDLDLTSLAGRLTVTTTVNGNPTGSFRVREHPCAIWSSSEGLTSVLLKPGSYTVDLVAGNVVLGSFPATIVAGQETNLGTLDFVSGGLTGTVNWKGQPASGPNFELLAIRTPRGAADDIHHGTYRVAAPVGPETVSVYGFDCPLPQYRLAEASATASAGEYSPLDFDISASAGRVIGLVSLNGSLSALRVGLLGAGASCPTIEVRNGVFIMYLPPGHHDAAITGSGVRLATLGLDVVAGQTTDATGGTTLGGTNSEAAVSGGLGTVGGLTLTFDNVSTAGATTATPISVTPPANYQIVGGGQAHSWNISTTATFEGSIKVCVHYDPAAVQGLESDLRLLHDGGSGFVDVTSSLDVSKDIICGTTTSLSPFAVVEPADPDRDDDGVLNGADKCAATAPGSIVNRDGCSVDDLVPCAGIAGKPWKNNGEYVSAFTKKANEFVAQMLLTLAQKDALVARAGRSQCGK
jgi:hypothetical protein